jgi:hypothetical protein
MPVELLSCASELLADLDELGFDGALIVDVLVDLRVTIGSFIVDVGSGKRP